MTNKAESSPDSGFSEDPDFSGMAIIGDMAEAAGLISSQDETSKKICYPVPKGLFELEESLDIKHSTQEDDNNPPEST